MKLTKKQVTQAVNRYARKHGFDASYVRRDDELRQKAVKEYKEQVLHFIGQKAVIYTK